MKREFRTLTVAFVLCVLVAWPVQSEVANPPEDAEAIEMGLKGLIDRMETSSLHKSMDLAEFIVSIHLLAHGEPPAPETFLAIRALSASFELGTPEILSLVIRGDEPGPTWDQCRQFLERFEEKTLQADPEVKALAALLKAMTPESIIAAVEAEEAKCLLPAPRPLPPPIETPVEPPSFNTYFGYLHDHSELSLDATGDPFEAYRVARDVGGLDFHALTDHAEFLILWPWNNKWKTLRQAADAADEPGVFAALWGFEWSNPVLGHINVMNSDGFVSCLAPFGLGDFFAWLHTEPQAFAQFNHPGDFNAIGTEFFHFKRYPLGVRQMTALELWNTNQSFDRYHYAGSWKSDTPYYDVANLKGWRIGAAGGQDNHREQWGFLNDFRVGVLAGELTREGIAEAFFARRTYATENSNLYLDFRSSGHPMGSRLKGLPRTFTVTASNGDGDNFQEIRLIRNGVVIQSVPVEGNPVEVEFNDPESQGNDYYYVIVTQTGDSNGNGRNDEAISSPIWFFDASPPCTKPPVCGLIASGATPGAGIGQMLFLAGLLPIFFLLRRKHFAGSKSP